MLHIEGLVLYGGLVGSQRDTDSLKSNSSVMQLHRSQPIEHLDLHSILAGSQRCMDSFNN